MSDDSTTEPKKSPAEVKEAVQAIYRYGATLLRAGHTPAEVEDALVAKNVERNTAEVIVRKLIIARDQASSDVIPGFDEAKRAEGKKNMLIGALICIAGAVITAVSYSSTSGGGRYMIAWGAIIFGAIRFIRGASQAS